jgi:hypothetical protein
MHQHGWQQQQRGSNVVHWQQHTCTKCTGMSYGGSTITRYSSVCHVVQDLVACAESWSFPLAPATMENPESDPTLQYDIAEQVTQLLQCEATLRSLRGVSREWKGLVAKRIRHLRPRAGQRGGTLDLEMLAER